MREAKPRRSHKHKRSKCDSTNRPHLSKLNQGHDLPKFLFLSWFSLNILRSFIFLFVIHDKSNFIRTSLYILIAILNLQQIILRQDNFFVMYYVIPLKCDSSDLCTHNLHEKHPLIRDTYAHLSVRMKVSSHSMNFHENSDWWDLIKICS